MNRQITSLIKYNYHFNSRFLAKYIVIPITEDVVAIAATFVDPIFSPHSHPAGRQLMACVMSRHSFPATMDSSVSLTSRCFRASALSSDACCKHSLLHHILRIELDVLELKFYFNNDVDKAHGLMTSYRRNQDCRLHPPPP